jgi:hypothetical protein
MQICITYVKIFLYDQAERIAIDGRVLTGKSAGKIKRTP